MVNLESLKGMPRPKVVAQSSREVEGSGPRDASKGSTPRRQSGLPKVSRPRKKAKTGTWKMSEASTTREKIARGAPEVGIAAQAEGSAKGKGGVGPSGDDPLGKLSAHPKSMRDLCRIRPCTEGDPFRALSMADLPKGELEVLYTSRWLTLKVDSRIWSDESAT